MSDRVCIRDCKKRGIHYATCEGEPCTGCAPEVCRDGSMICDRCFGRMRKLLDDAPDLLARLRSIIDPSKATPLDQVRVRVMSTEPAAAVAADPLDAIAAVEGVLDVWAAWSKDLQRISNDLEAASWMGVHVLDRHKADDGLRELWSVQDAVDRWGVERREKDKYVFPDEPDREEEVTPVREFFDPTLTVKQAAERKGVTQQAVRKWVALGVLVPRMKVKGPRGSVMHLFYASEIDAAADLMEERAKAGQYAAQASG